MDTPKLTGLSKRRQIDSANKTMFLWVAIAAIVVSFAIVGIQFIYRQFDANNKVLAAKYKASGTLSDNLDNVDALKENVSKLVGNQNLTASRNQENENNLQVVLDALPTKSDVSAFGGAIQQVIAPQSGVTLESLDAPNDEGGVTEDGSTEATTSDSGAVEQRYSLTVIGSYQSIQSFLQNVEKTIRPVRITTMTVSGTDNTLRASIELVTYYQPEKNVSIKQEAVR